MPQTSSILSREGLFSGLSASEAKSILARMRPTSVPRGQAITHQGESARGMYIITSGLLKVTVASAHGEDVVINYLRPGDHFGALGLLAAGPRLRSVIAVTDAELLELTREDFDVLVSSTPRFAANLCRWLADWLAREITHARVRPRPGVVALVRTTPATGVLAPQILAALNKQGPPSEVFTDRPDAFPSLRDLPVRELRIDVASMASVCAALGALRTKKRQVILDVESARVSPTLLLACDQVWWLVEVGAYRGAEAVLDVLLRHAPDLADRISLIWLTPVGDRLPPTPALRVSPADRHARVAVTMGTTGGLRLGPAGIARLVHRLQGLQLGLALGGGGSRGVAHCGVLHVFERAGLFFDRLAGTSVGAAVAACYAAGHSPERVRQFFIADLAAPRFVERLPSGSHWYLWANFHFHRLERRLRQHVHHYTFDQLEVPIHTVCVDLNSGREVVRSSGDVALAVLESINLPTLARPLARHGQLHIDGGVLNNLPADVLRCNGADFVVAVDLFARLSPHHGHSIWATLRRILEIQQYRLTSAQMSAADVLLAPDLSEFDFENFSHADELFERGAAAAEAALPEIRKRLADFYPG